MVAVVLDAYRLGEPFELGNQGTFEASNNGNLYVRCRDDWNLVARQPRRDPSAFHAAGKDRPLRRPRGCIPRGERPA